MSIILIDSPEIKNKNIVDVDAVDGANGYGACPC